MNNLTVRGITIRDSPMFHIVSQGGSHKRFSNLSLLSGCGFATAPNTDGFNVGGDDIIVSNSHGFSFGGLGCVFRSSSAIIVRTG